MSDVDNTAEHRARLTVVEHRLEEVSNVVKELAHSFNKWVQNQGSAPRPVPFKEIIATALSSILLFAAVVAFFDARVATAIEIARSKDIGANAVLQYRLDEMHRKVNPTVQLVKPVQ